MPRPDERTSVDFWDLTRLLGRRWYVAVPMLVLSLTAAGWAAVSVEPDYTATSYVQLIPPTVETRNGQAENPQNPWLSMGLGSLAGAATIKVSDATVLQQLKAEGYSDNFTLAMEGQLPIIKIEVVGATAKQASGTSRQVVTLIESNVRNLQTTYNVPERDRITTQRLDLGENVTASTSKVKRAVVAIGGAGILLSAGLTIAFDAWLRRWARRRSDVNETWPADPVGEVHAPGAKTSKEPGKPARAGAPMGAWDGSDPANRAPASLAAAGYPPAPVNPARKEAAAVPGPAAPASTTSTAPAGEETAVIARNPTEATIVLPMPESLNRARRRDGGPRR